MPGGLDNACLMLDGISTRKVDAALFNWMQLVSSIIDQSAETMIDVTGLGTVDATGTTDVGPAVQVMYNLAKSLGRALYFPPGTYKFSTVGIALGTGKLAPIVLSAGTTLVASLLSGLSDPTGVLLYANPTIGAVTTLAAGGAIGDETLTLTSAASFPDGTNFFVLSTDGASGAQYTVKGAPAGAVVTLDRALDRTFPNGSAVRVMTTRSEEFVLIGNGGKITGVAFRYAELDHMWRGYAENLVIDDSQGFAQSGAWNYDTASYCCVLSRCKLNGPSGWAFESCEASLAEYCTADAHGALAAGATGLYMSDCTSSRMLECNVSRWRAAGASGAIMTTQGALGCLDCEMSGMQCVDNSTGIIVHIGARVTLNNCNLPKNDLGLSVDANTPGFSASNINTLNSINGMSFNAGATVPYALNNIDVSGCTNQGIVTLSDLEIFGFRCNGGWAGATAGNPNTALVATTCKVSVVGADVNISGAIPAGVTPTAFSSAGTGKMRISKANVHLQGNPCAAGQVAFAPVGTSVMTIDDCEVDDPSAAGASRFVFSTAAGIFVREKLLRYPAGFTATVAGLKSRGTAVLVAGTKVVSWTDLQLDDLVRVQLKTVGGTTGFPSVAMTAGTGFTVNSTNAADTGTYEWEVV